MSRILLAMFRRQQSDGGWLYSLLASLAVVIVAAISVYVLTRVWREYAGQASADDDGSTAPGADAQGAASYLSLTPFEILDRRLAVGEITVAQYDELTGVLNRRFAAAAWSGTEQPSV
jgi:hypothetical protein